MDKPGTLPRPITAGEMYLAAILAELRKLNANSVQGQLEKLSQADPDIVKVKESHHGNGR